MVAREDLNPFPNLLAEFGILLRLGERFAVDLALFAFDVQADGADQIARVADNQLKVGEPLFQVEHL